MDVCAPPSGTPQQPKGASRFSLSSWWALLWVPACFSSTAASATLPSPSLRNSPLTNDKAVSFNVDEGTPHDTPVPAGSRAALPGVPSSSISSVSARQEPKENGDGWHAAAVASTATCAASVGGRGATTTAPAATTMGELKISRVLSVASPNGSSSASMAAESFGVAESSASTTPHPSASAASTPSLLTPAMAPVREELHTMKPVLTLGIVTPSNTRAGNGSGAWHSFLLPAAAVATSPCGDPFAVDQMRTPPACVELPGPQSLFIRGGAASGCDSHSIGLLQKSVLAEQQTPFASHSP